jgi:hypothetical protein
MPAPTPHRIAPAADHCVAYVECTIPPGLTLDEWRRAPRGTVRRRRGWSNGWLGRVLR